MSLALRLLAGFGMATLVLLTAGARASEDPFAVERPAVRRPAPEMSLQGIDGHLTCPDDARHTGGNPLREVLNLDVQLLDLPARGR